MKLVIYLLLFVFTIQLSAQTTLSGSVKDKKGIPIVGANVYIENSYDGATTDQEGNFSFKTKKTGIVKLIVSYVTFQTFEKTADVSELHHLEIKLKESVNTLDAVVLTAGSLHAGDNSKIAVMSPLDVVTTAGVAGDFISALQTLPGTQTVGEDGRLFVRGGTAEETQVFIDGMQVFKPYSPTVNNVPTRGRYSPFLFDGITFSTGGYSAEYGNALSSILLLNTIDEPKQNETNLSFMTLGGGVGHTKKWNKDALTINASYINLAFYHALFPDKIIWKKSPESISGETVYRHQTKKGLFKFYSAFDYSKFDVQQEEINTLGLFRTKLKNTNWYTNASYEGFLTDELKFTTGISYSNSKDDVNQNIVSVLDKENSFHFKAKLKHLFSNQFKLSYGIEYLSTSFKEDGIVNKTNPFSYDFTNTISAAFAEAEIFFSKDFAGKFGIRGEQSKLFNQFSYSPRLSLAYKVSGKSQLSLAYGDFYQSPQNSTLKIEQNLMMQKATHYILNYQYKKDRQLFRAELFYKDYDKLVLYDTQFGRPSSNFSNKGYGFAKGIDLFWKDSKSIKNLQYWFSYSYLDTERKYQDFPIAVMPNYAAKHNASIVTKYWFNSLNSQAGLTYAYASGRPYHNPNSKFFMDGSTKSYHNISINWSYLISQQKILYLSVSNVLGIKNVFGYNYTNTPDSAGIFKRRAIVPNADRFFFVGFFWTISDDKTKNQLDNL